MNRLLDEIAFLFTFIGLLLILALVVILSPLLLILLFFGILRWAFKRSGLIP